MEGTGPFGPALLHFMRRSRPDRSIKSGLLTAVLINIFPAFCENRGPSDSMEGRKFIYLIPIPLSLCSFMPFTFMLPSIITSLFVVTLIYDNLEPSTGRLRFYRQVLARQYEHFLFQPHTTDSTHGKMRPSRKIQERPRLPMLRCAVESIES